MYSKLTTKDKKLQLNNKEQSMKITLSVIKADVGSIGGHTKPTEAMLTCARQQVQKAIADKLLVDGLVTHTGDDIALTLSHTRGTDSSDVHTFAWETFLKTTEQARKAGLYGAGQDLLVDAPSGNVRGAGPGVAELTFDLLSTEYRKSEPFIVLYADKCGPGAFNLPLYLAFADPMYCAGLMLPKMIEGFSFDIVDMNYTGGGTKQITLHAPEDAYKIAFLLRDNETFGIKAIYSRKYEEPAVSTSTDRLHSIAGVYTGKDDPVTLIRTQGIFPAAEELLSPYVKAHYVGGDARGSHNMPLMPIRINSAVSGIYCLPIVSCLGFSVNAQGKFADSYVDFFDNPAWDAVRLKAQEKAIEMRSQGWSGPAMLPYSELEYGGFKTTFNDLIQQFIVIE
jgi:fructose 1,6-bisphosphate aldolase/phosphatase